MSVTGFKFAEFELYPHRCELRRSGQPVKLENIPLNLLTLLVEKKGGLVSRQEIVERLWGADVFLDTEHGINTAIRKIRRILGDDPEEPRFVRTVTGKGYCFVAELTAIEELTSSGNGNREKAQTPSLVPLPDATGISLKVVIIFGIPALLVSAALLILWLNHRPRLPQPRLIPLTTLPGREISPSFSPDGSQVAFGWDGENDGAGFDLYVKVIGTDKALRLTNHPAPWLATAWSPNGRYIAVNRLAAKESGIFLIPALGGPEQKLISTSAIPGVFPPSAPVSWSRDGQEMAFVDHPPNSEVDSLQLFILSLATLNLTQMNTNCPRVWFPVFSPDRDVLAYLCSEDYDHESLSLIRLHSGKNERLSYEYESFARRDFDGMAWSSDGRKIVLSEEGNIWEYTLGESHPMRKVWTGHEIGPLAISPIGNRLAYEQSNQNVNIWQLNLKNIDEGAHKLVVSTRTQYGPHISPNGEKIVFASDRSGSDEIWVCDKNGDNAVQLTSLRALTGTARWSPDGRQIVFDSRAGGEANIYLINADGGLPRKLDTGTKMNSMPSWSHDGRWIYFVSGSGTLNHGIWRVSPEGGRGVQLSKSAADMPIEAPDGRYVYFVRNYQDAPRLWRMRADGTDETLLEKMPPVTDAWWPFRPGIYFIDETVNDRNELDFFDLNTSRISHLYRLPKPAFQWVGGLAVSPDGGSLLYSQLDEDASDLMLIEDFH